MTTSDITTAHGRLRAILAASEANPRLLPPGAGPDVHAVLKENRILREQRAIFRDRLANAVVAAIVESEGTDGFIAWYLMPTGPIHKAIHELKEYAHVTVRPGLDGRKDLRHPLDPFGLEPVAEVVIGAGSPETSALTHCPTCGAPEWHVDGRRGWNPVDVECEDCAGTYSNEEGDD